MATDNTNSGVMPDQAGDSGGLPQLLQDIKDTKHELKTVKERVQLLEQGDPTGLVKSLGFKTREEALEHLREKEKQLREQLNLLQKEKNLLLEGDRFLTLTSI